MSPSGPVVLLGLMATGKSTIGALVAERLGRPLLDSDEQILARTGRTVRQLVDDGGPDAHRELESAVLLDALARPDPVVVAAAAGVVLDPVVVDALACLDGTVVWLRADPTVLAERVADGDHRPPIPGDAGAWLAAAHAERAPRYVAVADLVVDVDGVPAAVLAERIVTHVSAGASR
jgi:shikimate kinase